MMTHIANYVSTIANRLGMKWDFDGDDYKLRWFTANTVEKLHLPRMVDPDRLLELEEDIGVLVQSYRAFNSKWGI